jgi:hypothetical protein
MNPHPSDLPKFRQPGFSRWLPIASVVLAAWAATGLGAEESSSPREIAGRYHIDDQRSLEASGIRHQFDLLADGTFVLAGNWPDHETSRFTGRWQLNGGRVELAGEGDVRTNQGDWHTAFTRVYRVDRKDGAIRLTPIPEKNRFGILGWPNAFVRAEPAATAVPAR